MNPNVLSLIFAGAAAIVLVVIWLILTAASGR